VDVQRQLVRGGVAAELLEPVAWACTDGVGGDADPDPGGAQLLELAEILGHRLLAEAIDPPARVGDVEEDELDLGLRSRLRNRASVLEPEVVELGDRRVAGVPQLAVDVDVARSDVSRCLTPG
jgi:hypothetical protein